MKIYTRRGDDGSTGLFHGGRVAKDESGPEAYGTVDEATAALGVARSLATGSMHDAILAVQRELFVVGAELATSPDRRGLLEAGTSLVTAEMVVRLEAAIDAIEAERGMPTEFIVPGGNPVAAALDVARTVTRRAERRAVTHARLSGITGSYVVPYLNRLADYLYMLARSAEAAWVPSRLEEGR
ncbi:MAG TPA: cob(I)yrinic acid a,c-diamide adenosyltransferase [Actinobacteria bacterium]|nr:cob(I)yrinic acid a,c-diamide adenosyltransferase [Actinomycetota bacterium]